MNNLKKINSKAKAIEAILVSLRASYLSDSVYLIDKSMSGTTPSVTLWISDYDYRALIVLINGTSLHALEVEVNTARTRKDGKFPEGTERFKYVSIG